MSKACDKVSEKLVFRRNKSNRSTFQADEADRDYFVTFFTFAAGFPKLQNEPGLIPMIFVIEISLNLNPIKVLYERK
jgi:hypothetical protein